MPVSTSAMPKESAAKAMRRALAIMFKSGIGVAARRSRRDRAAAPLFEVGDVLISEVNAKLAYGCGESCGAVELRTCVRRRWTLSQNEQKQLAINSN